MEFITIEVKEREARGTRAMVRMRASGETPAVLYGLKRRNLPLSIPTEDLLRFLKTGSHLLELKMGGEARDAIVREVQIDSLTDEVLHIDLHRVDKDAEVEDDVPVVYKGTAQGTKEGGMFQGLMDYLKVKARPRDLPREILIEIASLLVGDEVRIKDIEVPQGVVFLHEDEDMIAHVVAMRGVEEEEEGEDGEPKPIEPELIGKDGAEGGES